MPAKRYPLHKRFSMAMSTRAYQRLRRLNGKFGYGNNCLPTILPEHVDVVVNKPVSQKVFSAFTLEYGTPPVVA